MTGKKPKNQKLKKSETDPMYRSYGYLPQRVTDATLVTF
jgi:hypothetical protein